MDVVESKEVGVVSNVRGIDAGECCYLGPLCCDRNSWSDSGNLQSSGVDSCRIECFILRVVRLYSILGMQRIKINEHVGQNNKKLEAKDV